MIEGSLALLDALSVALDHPFDAMSHNSAPLLLNVVIHNLNIVFSYYDELECECIKGEGDE
ncbi:hypothetical protein [Rappaport israeli]|uniref:hypothetical protein n=1 Tax=Rappaport israeli TaxID=1839807 RepID=UPI000A7E06D5|nr:hypothetical protein [Rappaport israeli]